MNLSLQEAIDLLLNDQVVALPTETVYGLAAPLHSKAAIEKIFLLKNRPLSNPLIIHVAAISEIEPLIKSFPKGFLELTNAFWPGPLTLILPILEEKINPLARANLPTAAFRVPNHPLTLEIIKNVGPIVMPSANKSGKPSATSSLHVQNDFGINFPVMEGGISKKGLESTILVFKENKWSIARQGAISDQELKNVLGYLPEIVHSHKPICPGQHFRHYAPETELYLEKDANNLKDVVVGFSDRSYLQATYILNVGSSHSPHDVAENLYSILRRLDEEKIEKAYVDINFPVEGLWKTILERLEKASKKV